jgi:NADPH:quinone reductase
LDEATPGPKLSIFLVAEMVFSRIMYRSAPHKQGNILEVVAALIAEGRMKPIATARLDGLSAETMKTTHELVETKRTIGKVVIAT